MAQVPHHFPSFLWKFWRFNLQKLGSDEQSTRIHVYDVYSNELSELKRAQCQDDFDNLRPVFQDFGSVDGSIPPDGVRVPLEKAEAYFASLQKETEAILGSIISSIYLSSHTEQPQLEPHSGSGLTSSLPIDDRSLNVLIKFFAFLRFRNSVKYRDIVSTVNAEHAVVGLYSGRSAADDDVGGHGLNGRIPCLSEAYSPFFRYIRCQQVLNAFIKFFEADFVDPRNMAQKSPRPPQDVFEDVMHKSLWEFCSNAEVCLGVAGEDDEYILPDCCFGILDEAFGWGREETDPTKECLDSFFPILPTLAVYIMTGTGSSADARYIAPTVKALDVGSEQAIDIHLRNAMVLASIQHHHNYPHQLSFDPVCPLGSHPWSGFSNSSSSSLNSGSPHPHLPPSRRISSGSMYKVSLPGLPLSTLCLSSRGPKLFFSSLNAMVRSLSSYDEFRCRWIPDLFIDYSRLKQRCRQLFLMETVTKTLVVREETLVDLTDEVQLDGKEAVAFGAFSDVFRGRLYDRVEKKDRVVAIKFIRHVMLRNTRDKVLKRLQEEILCWHRLSHRNVSQLFGLYQSPVSIGMVSPWCENGSITKYLKSKPEADRLKLLVQIASGVGYLHGAKPPVVHGDLKGGNILVDSHERPVITDFGLSKVMEDLSNTVDELKGSSFFAGSTRWMAPELILALVEDDGPTPRVTTHSDVYAFASVCLEIITGQLPYPHRRNDKAVTCDILRGIKPSRGARFSCEQLRFGKGRHRAEQEEELRDMLDKCWDPEPLTRPSMGEVFHFLIGLQSGS